MPTGEIQIHAEHQGYVDRISHQYRRYMAEDQTRNDRNQLVSPIAKMFEQRMNLELQDYHDFITFIGEATVMAPDYGNAV